MTGPLYVAATGLCCPIGLSIGPAYAAMRAGINRFESSTYVDDDGEPIVASALSVLDLRLGRRERLVQLLARAVFDAAGARLRDRLPALPMFVGTADPRRPGGTTDIVPALRTALTEQYQLRLPDRVHMSTTGSTAGLRALAAARECLACEREVSACIVVSGDSLVNASALAWLSDHERLKRDGRSDGVIPGEAAACVVLARRPQDGALPVVLSGLGFARETATLASDEPTRAAGLTAAVHAALAESGLSLADMDVRLSDAAGESLALKEQALMLGRLLRDRHPPIPLVLPAESLGDTGAAAGLVSLVMGVATLGAPRMSARRALVVASDIDGDRSAAVLTAPQA